ncbi:acylneuraminate cytidylyltransferase family protein [Patescibacteria group bacterium]|nr:acylneuraminate cytidylyltransferase family protein [Patescibacteria group bacterium]
MLKNKKIIAVIPARGGSKGIPRKNIRLLGGKPLLFYMLKAAINSKYLDRIAFSSEDKEILNIAQKCAGSSKKFILIKRPKELARDNTQSLPVIQHAVNKIEKDEKTKFDIVIMLQATSPFVNNEDIDKAIKKMINKKSDVVVSVAQVPGNIHPIKMKKIINDKLVQFTPCLPEKVFRRQDFKPAYKRNGGIYVAKRDNLIKSNSPSVIFWDKVTRPYIMPLERSIDIDTLTDFIIAEQMLKNLKKKNANKK